MIVIAGGTVLTVDDADHVYAPGHVVLDGDRITAVGPGSYDPASGRADAEVINATGMVVLPGLIDLHESLTEVENSKERFGRRPTEVAYEAGLLGPRTVAAHCVWLSDTELGMMRETGTQIAHNPSSNAKLGNGIARVPEMLAAGINVGLGHDAAESTNNTRSPMFTPLVPGDRAHLYSHLVYAANGSAVDTTIVDGRVLMRGRRLLTMDEDRILAEANAGFTRIVDRING